MPKGTANDTGYQTTQESFPHTTMTEHDLLQTGLSMTGGLLGTQSVVKEDEDSYYHESDSSKNNASDAAGENQKDPKNMNLQFESILQNEGNDSPSLEFKPMGLAD